ncbi:aminoacyl-tRNA hydrolase [Candidatus Peregrinibacteria bacterium CG10_big_fil_rev_8_21_14_0_10_49_24]|nr:MAG: aminoacyl-tRNA hydrolase [Candidatus Peregrinibacteria bacterium CG11_big_fil_rev_8_21_14_0_20_49_14]PIR51034.1 MAG: aminoacyl-tRNA hydrolase [Candidatus Peregrinibacteria bacterium CG10_big_fil_rev_8_21_14_0_10_49_24]PJA67587.1 MAG: aminoacyl-tRNA hydrolase [Candidatus Peregrinibacteria bacterium CG_4_9_14_3_um_filter_49_12]
MKPALVIVGLGNPGKQYEATRHNIGFHAIDVLSQHCGEGDWEEKQRFLASVQEARIVTVPVLLVKPSTFMNLSGNAIAKIVDFYKLDPAVQILVICDDIDLPLGEVRLRKKGGPGTHNGLKSVCEKYGEEFPRLRIGIGSQPPGADLSAWVLSIPSSKESVQLQEVLQTVPALVREFVLEEDSKKEDLST